MTSTDGKTAVYSSLHHVIMYISRCQDIVKTSVIYFLIHAVLISNALYFSILRPGGIVVLTAGT